MTDLKDLMHRAVADAPYDGRQPADILGAAERDLRRHRAWTSALVAAALVVTLGVAWGALSLWRDREPPVLDNPVDGSPGALAAVAIGHTNVTVSDIQGGRGGELFPAGSVWATMHVKEPGRSRPGILTVAASPEELPAASDCERSDGCADIETAAGTVRLSWTRDMRLGDQGVVLVWLRRGDEWLSVAWTGHGVTGDPRDADLVVSVDDLVAIVTDPAFGLETSEAAAARGQQLIPE
ncbi:MAG: hypothetical protein U0R78_18895 [Nocardioidaceae bacterium]